MDDTARLIQEASRGDAVAFEDLIARYLPELRAFVRLRLGARLRAKESSDDIVQSVCRELLEDLDEFEYHGEAAFKEWFYVSALRKIADRGRFYGRRKRDAGREVRMLTDAQLASGYASLVTPSREVIRKEEVQQLESAFEQMPEDHREVITLARVVGLSHAEIADRMGRSEGAVRVLLHRAIARLAVLVDGQNE